LGQNALNALGKIRGGVMKRSDDAEERFTHGIQGAGDTRPPAPAGESGFGFVQKNLSDRKRISNKTTLTPCLRRGRRGRQVTLSRPTGEGTARPVSRSFQSGRIRRPTEDDSLYPIRWGTSAAKALATILELTLPLAVLRKCGLNRSERM